MRRGKRNDGDKELVGRNQRARRGRGWEGEGSGGERAEREEEGGEAAGEERRGRVKMGKRARTTDVRVGEGADAGKRDKWELCREMG